MCETELCWTMVSAVGQVAGAIATFFAAAISLWIALYGRRPQLGLKVGERMIIGGLEDGFEVIIFEVVNKGERPVHIRGIGWRTGYFRWAPKFLKRQHAVQCREVCGSALSPLMNCSPAKQKPATSCWPTDWNKRGRTLSAPFLRGIGPCWDDAGRGSKATSIRPMATSDMLWLRSRLATTCRKRRLMLRLPLRLETHDDARPCSADCQLLQCCALVLARVVAGIPRADHFFLRGIWQSMGIHPSIKH